MSEILRNFFRLRICNVVLNKGLNFYRICVGIMILCYRLYVREKVVVVRLIGMFILSKIE